MTTLEQILDFTDRETGVKLTDGKIDGDVLTAFFSKGGAVVGLLTVTCDGTRLDWTRVILDSSVQSQGITNRLVTFAHKLAVKNGVETFTATPFSAARTLTERHGLTPGDNGEWSIPAKRWSPPTDYEPWVADVSVDPDPE